MMGTAQTRSSHSNVSVQEATLEPTVKPTSMNVKNDPCRNGGTCRDGISSYECECMDGYTGENCESGVNKCGSDPCQNGGNCEDQTNGYICSCTNGYMSAQCETNIDDCGFPNPCQHGGTCVDALTGYNCHCFNGYSGNNCETNIDECASDPCENDGNCTDQVNSYDCQCNTGYYGKSCEKVNKCTSNPALMVEHALTSQTHILVIVHLASRMTTAKGKSENVSPIPVNTVEHVMMESALIHVNA